MISFALQMYWYVLLLYVIFSWVPNPPDALLRRTIPPLRIGMVALDLSIIVLFIGVRLLSGLFASVGL
jgi:YggT family protein